MKKITLASFAMVTLLACDGHYRYPCQDPQNFGKVECNPPLCELNGECTKYLITLEQPKTETPIAEVETVIEEIQEVVPDNPDIETNGMDRIRKMEIPSEEMIDE